MVVATNRKIKEGEVVSDKMVQTVVVKVERLVQHPVYKKVVKRTRKFMAHDEEGQCKVGDKVKIIETRPISKLKRWKVFEIIEKAK
mgnify:CR=1 FL=1